MAKLVSWTSSFRLLLQGRLLMMISCYILYDSLAIPALIRVSRIDSPLNSNTFTNKTLDENREIVVSGNHTANIVRHFLNTKLINVAVPVIYNICTDYGEIS